MSTSFFWLLGGLSLCWGGAELLVRGAAQLALGFGVRPLVVGLTVVALGTSAPEAVVSFLAARGPSGEMAVGNVLGSNIANIALVLGGLALLHPIPAHWSQLRRDLWLLLLVTAASLWAAWTGGGLSNWEGLLLLAGLLLYFWNAVRSGRVGLAEGVPRSAGNIPRAIALSLLGLVVLLFGARRFLGAAVEIATEFGLPEAAVGATILAVGTSLPEFAASIVALTRGHHEIGIGNIVGSNVVNLLFVLGGVAALRATGLEVVGDARTQLIPLTALATIALLLLVRLRPALGRREGLGLVAAYAAFALHAYGAI